MKEICSADSSTFKHVRFVLTDMDETLTYKGALRLKPIWRWNGCRMQE